MRIAIFTDCYLPIKNGVVTSIIQLKDGLKARGHEVIVMTPEVPDYDDEDDDVFRMPAIKAGLGTEQMVGIVNQGAVTRFIKKRNIDLIHTHTEFSLGYSGKLVAKKLKIPHIHTSHTMWESYTHYILNGKILTSKMVQRIMRIFLKKITANVAPSVKIQKYNREIIPEVPIVVINNGIDVSKFKSSVITEREISDIRNKFGLSKKDKLMIFVGRIGKEKRVCELFDTVTEIMKKNSSAKMIFVGDGPELNELIKRAKKIGMEKRFVFTGFVNWDLVYRFYSISTIFLTSSLSEVQPMTIIEAIMCGLPVIVRKDDSYMDLVQEGINGHLVDSDEELFIKLDALLKDEEKLRQYSIGSSEISERFTAENHVKRMEKLYNVVLEHYPNKIDEKDFLKPYE